MEEDSSSDRKELHNVANDFGETSLETEEGNSLSNSDLDNTQFLKKIESMEEERPNFEETGRMYYRSECRKEENVIPCNIYLRNIQNEFLNLCHYGLGERGMKPLASSLVYNKFITHLNLTDNCLCDKGIELIVAMIKVNEVITNLNLSYNQLTSACTQTLTETLANSAILTKLDLSHNEFDDDSATHFGELMILSLRLEYLNLSYNRFESNCLAPFGKAFLQTTSIIHLDLSFNSIGGKPDMVEKFTKGLTKNECFKYLDLSSNAFSTKENALSFGKMLKLNTTLEELNLTNNRINTEAVVYLAKGLTECKSLKILRIGRNPILSAGCYVIINYILKNKTPPFKILDFESIDVNEDFKVLADKLLEHIPDIVILTGVRLISRITSNIDPIVRVKILLTKRNIKIIDFFKRYVENEEDKFIKLDDTKEMINDFCTEYEFNLLDSDKRRWFKRFPRKTNRTVSFNDIAKMFDEEYTRDIEDTVSPIQVPENVSVLSLSESSL